MGTQIFDLNPKVSRSNTHPEPGHIGALETLRGLGALIVLGCHLAGFFGPASFQNAPSAPQFPVESWLRWFPCSLLLSGRFAVSLFFVLSGVVLSLRHLGPHAAPERVLAGAVVKRLFRLLPMVLATAVLTVALGRAGLLYHLEYARLSSFEWLAAKDEWQKPIQEMLRQAWYRPITEATAISPPLYTIGLEIQGSFLIFALLFLMRHVLRHRWILGFTVLVFHADALAGFVVGLLLADLFQNSQGFRQWAARPVFAIPGLVLGLWLGSQQLGGLENLEHPLGTAFLPPIHFGYYGWQMLGAILVMAVVLGNPALLRVLDFPIGRWLGSISYGLYAIHFTVLSSLGCWIALRLPGSQTAGASLLTASAACTIVSLLAGWALREGIDRPSQRLAAWVARVFIPSRQR